MSDVVRRVAAYFDDLARSHARPLIAVDGPDAAGKTWFADTVASHMTTVVCRASVDGFHHPASVRMRRGELSPEGCYRDSFDYDALAERLLIPFAEGSASVAVAVFDHRTDRACEVAHDVPPRAALIVDGVFLLRPELRSLWTCSLYLHAPAAVSIERALQRDVAAMGSDAAVVERYQRRYLPAQELYRVEADPQHHAHVVIDNRDATDPIVLKWGVG